MSLSPDTLWPPDHKMVDITATIAVSDVCDDAPTVEVVSIVSNEPGDTPGGGDGKTVNIQDVDLGADDREIKLRAERAGSGNGGIYAVTHKTTDSSGNESFAVGKVTVPHNQ